MVRSYNARWTRKGIANLSLGLSLGDRRGPALARAGEGGVRGHAGQTRYVR